MDNNSENINRVIYTADEITENVRIPGSVEMDLKNMVDKQLNKSGIFYRVFSRKKSASSLERKYKNKNYGDNKIQDLLGVRVNLYFHDDMDICMELLEDIFELVEWSTSENNVSYFSAIRFNGVFKLPKYLVDKISPKTWDMAIDQTFEIQIRTVFFEGWHEVEHDMRYKYADVWAKEEYSPLARKMNSIVATLELCDDTMVSVLEKFAYRLYKNQDWESMIRMHYRIRISDQKMYDGLDEILKRNANEIGKKFLKCKREILVNELINCPRTAKVSVNMIIAILNKKLCNDNPDIDAIMRKNDVFNDGQKEDFVKTIKREFLPLEKYNVCSNTVLIDGSGLDLNAVFKIVSAHIYKWSYGKFSVIFKDMSPATSNYTGNTYGYEINVEYKPEENLFNYMCTHLDLDVGGRIWMVECRVCKSEQDKNKLEMSFQVSVLYHEQITNVEKIANSNRPNFYRIICDDRRLNIYDVIKYMPKRRLITSEEDKRQMIELIKSSKRLTPVIMVASNAAESGNGMLDESWLKDYWVATLVSKVKYIAHVYTVDLDVEVEVCKAVGADRINGPGVYIFWQKDAADRFNTDYENYNMDEIVNCRYNFFRSQGQNIEIKQVPMGANSFMSMVIDRVKESITE